MILGNRNHPADLSDLPEAIQACFAYAKERDLEALADGTYEINGDSLFLNIAEYATQPPEARVWEAHKAYVDVQLILRGSERVDINFLEQMQEIQAQEEKDLWLYEGTEKARVFLQEGDFIICYPTDAHRAGICVMDCQETVKKAVFKVKLQVAG